MRIATTLAAVVCLTSALAAAEVKYAHPELLLNPARLARPNVARQFVILDARPKAEFDKEHVPGARWVDHSTWKEAFGDGKDVEGWSDRIGGLGIGADSKVVVYDDAAMKDAARIWWILRYWGVEDVRLLNGGWKQWKSKELPTTSDDAKPADAVAFQAEPRSKRLATKDQILDLLKTDGLQIVDARSSDEFCGIDKRSDRGGAIPGAKNLEWSDLINQKTNRFKSAAKLRHLFDEAGIDLNRPTASHCQSGGRASVMAFGLELMGAQDVRNYYKGWSEWGNADDTPVVVPMPKK